MIVHDKWQVFDSCRMLFSWILQMIVWWWLNWSVDDLLIVEYSCVFFPPYFLQMTCPICFLFWMQMVALDSCSMIEPLDSFPCRFHAVVGIHKSDRSKASDLFVDLWSMKRPRRKVTFFWGGQISFLGLWSGIFILQKSHSASQNFPKSEWETWKTSVVIS